MDNMRECITDANERKYGLWYLKDEKIAFRKCKCCGISFERGRTDYISKQIEKQNEAIKLLYSFLFTDVADPNLLGYLNVIFTDVIDYIDDDKKILLNHKLQQINNTTFISEENKIMIENFRKAINTDDNDLFFDTMEYFNFYNIDNLSNFIDTNKSFSK